MYYKTDVFLVAGLQKSGFSSAKFLLERGAKVYVYDVRDSELVNSNKETLKNLGATVLDGYEKAEKYCTVLVLSPGVPIDSPIVVNFKRAKRRIIGELELGFSEVIRPCIAVTGTNGKTTVCTMISSALNLAGVTNQLAGNIGTPLTEVVDSLNKVELGVLEVSSYQLESTYSFLPHIAVILNVTPDHLSRHYTLDNYALVKSKLIMPLKESEIAVLNYDDEIVRNFQKSTKAKIVWFSTKQKVLGAYVDSGVIYYKNKPFSEDLLSACSDVTQTENLLAVICVLKELGISDKAIISSIKEFKGVKHRTERLFTKNGITFVNDSKSTNPASTITAINNLSGSTVLIIGGYDKGLDYTELFNTIKNSVHIKSTVITGGVSSKMLETALSLGLENVSVCKDFEGAIKLAHKLSSSGDTLLLSPATSSFDEFTSYEERGERFAEIVKSLS